MLVSDIHAVRDDRHSCTAVGTLIHVFYQAAGAWIFSLGHAAFTAITSGVIGGRLKPYMAISWGMPLISMGVHLRLLHMFFVFISSLCGIVVLCNMATPALRKDNLIEDYGSFCRGAAFLILFFDLTWIFALLCYIRLDFNEPDFYPIFQVLNSCTGIILFLFIGLGSRRFRMVIAGQTKLRREMLKNYAFGKPRKTQDKEPLSSPHDQNSPPERPRSTPLDHRHPSQGMTRRPLSAN
ncbi:hypothetical protein Pcinc_015776 [Petrolisthes cinctipes]|uniref:Uncharacterized protein n=1 Tax=Petrolisthes cinctipes TaxID=88211 RepID=A0AAE1KQD2_PETCI|nr:hypothetical protein Pcinc_015776 [Petrolisthes cinctipes]